MIYSEGDRVTVMASLFAPGHGQMQDYVGTVQRGSSDETSHMGRPFRWVTVSHPSRPGQPGIVVSDRFLRKV